MRTAMRDAVAKIDARSVAAERDELRALGLPSVAAAERMLARMRELLWSGIERPR